MIRLQAGIKFLPRGMADAAPTRYGRGYYDLAIVDFDRGLDAAVTRLRQVLSDSAEAPRYAETVAGRGYHFIAPVNATGA